MGTKGSKKGNERQVWKKLKKLVTKRQVNETNEDIYVASLKL